MSIDLKFVELTADVLEICLYNSIRPNTNIISSTSTEASLLQHSVDPPTRTDKRETSLLGTVYDNQHNNPAPGRRDVVNNVGCVYHTRAPLRGRLTPPATLAHGRIQQNMKRAEIRVGVHDLVQPAI